MKGNLLQGTARGRMGEIVAKVVHGEQILAKYQPNVAQANTELQVRTKEKFAKAIDFTKLAKKTASIKLPYSVYLGSAKNMRSALIKQSLLAFDCFDVNGIKVRQSKPRQSSIFYKDLATTWGNKFEVEIGSNGLPSIVGTNIGTGNFFGSDIPLDANSFDFRTIVINTIKPENGQSLYEYSANSIDGLTLTPASVSNPVAGKNLGIYSDVNDCGNWNFYYNIKYSALVDSGAVEDIFVKVGENLPNADYGKYQCAHLMVVNQNSLLSYDFEELYNAPTIGEGDPVTP